MLISMYHRIAPFIIYVIKTLMFGYEVQLWSWKPATPISKHNVMFVGAS